MSYSAWHGSIKPGDVRLYGGTVLLILNPVDEEDDARSSAWPARDPSNVNNHPFRVWRCMVLDRDPSFDDHHVAGGLVHYRTIDFEPETL